jgi:NAD+ synthase (glutamine-hydrolysing)
MAMISAPLANLIERGNWPATCPLRVPGVYGRRDQTLAARVFLYRFFQLSQFKRSALPNGPKISRGSLSPRGDWRAPSDATATVWLEELEAGVPDTG